MKISGDIESRGWAGDKGKIKELEVQLSGQSVCLPHTEPGVLSLASRKQGLVEHT